METDSFVPDIETRPARRYITGEEYALQGKTYTELELEKLAERLRKDPSLAQRAPAYARSLAQLRVGDGRARTAVCAAGACAAVAALLLARANAAAVDAAAAQFFAESGPALAARALSALQSWVVALALASCAFFAWLASMRLADARLTRLAPARAKGAVDAALPLLCAGVFLALTAAAATKLAASADRPLGAGVARLFANVAATRALDGPPRLALGVFAAVGMARTQTAAAAALLALLVFAALLLGTAWTAGRRALPVLAAWAVLGAALVAARLAAAPAALCAALGELLAAAVPVGLFVANALSLRRAVRAARAAPSPDVWQRCTDDN